MLQTTWRKPAMAAVFLIAGMFTALAGGVDSYEIYLNDKLLVRQLVSQPLSLQYLPLDKANLNDNLVIYYNHCGLTGKGRKIAIKDPQGKIVKEWKFANGEKTGMTIPVKEMLQLQKQYAKNQLSLYYTSDLLPKGRMLASVF
jgi:hypothetical protein